MNPKRSRTTNLKPVVIKKKHEPEDPFYIEEPSKEDLDELERHNCTIVNLNLSIACVKIPLK